MVKIMKNKRLITLTAILLAGLSAHAAVGDTFYTNTVENVQMQFKILDEDAQTVEVWGYQQVNNGGVTSYSAAIPKTYNGALTIPDEVTNGGKTYSVVSIQDRAFTACNITSVSVPGSVVTIGSYAFDGCTKLVTATLHEGVGNIGRNAFNECYVMKTIDIPSSVHTIGVYAFNGCKVLKSLILPEDVTVVPTGMCSDCEKLERVTILGNVTEIKNNAFYRCLALASFTWPTCLESIGNRAFYLCQKLPYAILPRSVAAIGDEAFAHCYKLDYVKYYREVPVEYTTTSTNVGLFYGTSGTDHQSTLYVPEGSTSAYRSNGWTQSSPNGFTGGIVEMDIPEYVTIQIGSVGFSTYCPAYDLDFSNVEGLRAYVVTEYHPADNTLTFVNVPDIPFSTGLFLKGEPGAYQVPTTKSDRVERNLLVGTTAAATMKMVNSSYTNFILTSSAGKPLFVRIKDNTTLASGKAFLPLSTELLNTTGISGIKFRFIDDETDEPTGINATDTDISPTSDIITYDLQGRRITSDRQPLKGIYIRNGKKVFIP